MVYFRYRLSIKAKNVAEKEFFGRIHTTISTLFEYIIDLTDTENYILIYKEQF
jgi:hypothetical protein